jgi:GNAT superfamily N-acetyltransferase
MNGNAVPITSPANETASLLPLPSVPRPARERFRRVSAAPMVHGKRVTLHDGRTLQFRPIAASDIGALQRLFTRLSRDEIRMRFLHPVNVLPPTFAQRLCTPEPEREGAWVLMDHEPPPIEMRGVGRIYIDEATNSAEFSVLVEHGWTGRGLGAFLIRHLIDECRHRGVGEIWGQVLMENRPMLDLCKELGFRRRLMSDDPGSALISLALDTPD